MHLGISRMVLVIVAVLGSGVRAANPFQFGKEERIVFIGDDLFEGDAEQQYIETRLTARFPDKNLLFRNLGYSGDTVRADARSLCAGWQNFGPADQGFKRLSELLNEIRPTVVFVGYGMTESFSGESGLSSFREDLQRLLDMIDRCGKPRVVLVTPIRHEALPSPFPDPSPHNRDLEKYVRCIQSVAGQRGDASIDLFDALSLQASAPAPLTRDGIHLNRRGYWLVAGEIERELGYAPPAWSVQLDATGKVASARGTKVPHAEQINGGLKFEATDELLPALAPPAETSFESIRSLKIAGLAAGQYQLKAGGAVLASGSGDDFSRGVHIGMGPAGEQAEQLREAIARKNFAFFNYWRAQNDTYILGYRAHEQGRNAPELKEFAKLAEADDAEVAKLRVPRSVTYLLARTN